MSGRVGQGGAARAPPTVPHSPPPVLPPQLQLLVELMWPHAIPTPNLGSMNVSLPTSSTLGLGLGLAVVTPCTGAPGRVRSTGRALESWLRGSTLSPGLSSRWGLRREAHVRRPRSPFPQQAAAVSGYRPLTLGPHLQHEQHLFPTAHAHRGAWRPRHLQDSL